MKVLISKDRVSYGPYEMDEVNQYVQSGMFQPTDLAWSEGWVNWKSLSSVDGYQAPIHTFANPPSLPPSQPAPSIPGFSNPPPVSHVSASPSLLPARSPFPWAELDSDSRTMIIAGYACGGLSLLCLPPFAGLAGIILGVLTLKKGIVGHGIVIIAGSTVIAVIGICLGAATS